MSQDCLDVIANKLKKDFPEFKQLEFEIWTEIIFLTFGNWCTEFHKEDLTNFLNLYLESKKEIEGCLLEEITSGL